MKRPQPFRLQADFSDDGHKPVICPTRQVSKKPTAAAPLIFQ
jgi:hypothetical protein